MRWWQEFQPPTVRFRCVHDHNGRVDVSGLASCQELGTGDEITAFFWRWWKSIQILKENINQCFGSGSRKNNWVWDHVWLCITNEWRQWIYLASCRLCYQPCPPATRRVLMTLGQGVKPKPLAKIKGVWSLMSWGFRIFRCSCWTEGKPKNMFGAKVHRGKLWYENNQELDDNYIWYHPKKPDSQVGDSLCFTTV